MPRDTEDEIRAMEWEARRERRRASRCQCGDEVPGCCPGPAYCPNSDYAADEDEDADDE